MLKNKLWNFGGLSSYRKSKGEVIYEKVGDKGFKVK